jgi:hypothetical protein
MEEPSPPFSHRDHSHQSHINESSRTNNGIKNMSTRKRFEAEREQLLKNEENQKIEKELEIMYRILEEEEGIEDEHRSANFFSKLFLQEFTIALTTVISNKDF